MTPLQLTPDGRLRHLLTLDGLPEPILQQIFSLADSFLEVSERAVKKVPLLRGKSVFNIFFENSTRTRTTFEIAAARLSADVVNLNIATSSTAPMVRVAGEPVPSGWGRHQPAAGASLGAVTLPPGGARRRRTRWRGR